MAAAEDPMQDMMARLRREFLDTAEDRLASMDEIVDGVRRGGSGSGDELPDIRRMAHSLKGMGGTFGYPLVSVIAHRLEDYLADSTSLANNITGDVQTFLDRMRDVVDGVLGADDPRTAEIVRELPAKRGDFDMEGIHPLDIEVMTVMPKGTATTIVERELKACGYRVVNLESPFEAIEYAVRTKPDMVMFAGVLTGLSGVDLACAFKAMPVTSGIPVTLFTSFGREHSSLRELQEDVPIIRKGATFTEDLTDALFACGLT